MQFLFQSGSKSEKALKYEGNVGNKFAIILFQPKFVHDQIRN